MQRPPRRFAALCLSALVLVACTPGETGPSSASAPTDPPASVTGLKAEQPGAWSPSGRGWAVSLTWSASPGLASFQVRRDGVLVADALPTPRYLDEDVDPATIYRYAVTGTSPGGASSALASVTVETGAPATHDARLQGSFLVRMRVVRSSGLRTEPSGGDLLFRYAPACATGPCDVRWSVRAHRPVGRLARTLGSYRGRASGPFLVRGCNGGLAEEQLEITTRVTSAGPVLHAWRATRVEGTLVESGASPGCAVASITWAFAGVIQP